MATIILCGGLSARMGRDKASLDLEDSTIIQVLASRFAAELGPVIVVCRSGQDLGVEEALAACDAYAGCGPLGGIHAGLLASPDDENLVLACDMPFADTDVARYVLSRLGEHDAAVPMLEHGPEPLHAAYRKSCLPRIEANLRAGILRIRDLLDQIDTLYLPEDDLRRLDPQLRSFLNVNTPEAYRDAMRANGAQL